MSDSAVDRPLRLCLLGVVLLNLVFVQITKGVALHWLLPLYALTLAFPWLGRLQGNLLYRVLWNGGVLAIFALLVRHASQNGVHYLLEDGLILAAFCQVHLLNNLDRQKPDLLFFNSFLIALVTSFFCQDVVYAAVFAAYAIVLSAGLQLSASAGHGWPPGLLRDGAVKSMTALAITLVVFMVWPRDFARGGFVEDTLLDAGMMETGFSEGVELGRSRQTVASNRVVMQIRLLEGSPSDVPAHWRGATFSWYERNRWQPDTKPRQLRGVSLDEQWVQLGEDRWFRPGHESTVRVSVDLPDRSLDRVFAPLAAHSIDIEEPPGTLAVERSNAVVICMRPYSESGLGQLRYELELHDRKMDWSDSRRHSSLRALMTRLRMPRAGLPERGAELAGRLARGRRDAPQRAVVEAMRHHLATQFDYLLPGTRGAAGSLDEFFSGAAGGHCEYFATALTLMLRSQDIPCRLVTGFLCVEWDEAGQVLTVRGKHAHAWVEVLDPGGFWYVADPTPASDAAAVAPDPGTFEEISALARKLWDEIAAFDSDARAAALVWLRGLPGRTVRWFVGHPWTGAVTVGLVALLIGIWRRRRRLGTPAVVRSYLRAVRRAGVRPRPGETPREVLHRARQDGRASPAVLARLAVATEAHERMRYSGAC